MGTRLRPFVYVERCELKKRRRKYVDKLASFMTSRTASARAPSETPMASAAETTESLRFSACPG